MRVAAAMALVLASGCVAGEGPLMAPHQDCLGCHTGGDARRWTVAGTWRRGAKVDVVDSNGKSVTMTGNKVGNFYTAEGLRFPIRVWVDGVQMRQLNGKDLDRGSCNLCHVNGAEVNVGELMAPGSDCLDCHRSDGSGIGPAFSTAGTFWDVPANTQVTVGSTSTRTNAVGNFYITTPVTLGTASVGGKTMDNPGPSCNVCHHGTTKGAEGGDG